jgi:hypothetical protein
MFPTSAARSTLRDIIPLPPDAYTLFCEHEIANNGTLDQFKDNRKLLHCMLAELWTQARYSGCPTELASECLNKANSMFRAYFNTFQPPGNQLDPDAYTAANVMANCGGADFLALVLSSDRNCSVSALDMWNDMTAAEKRIYAERERRGRLVSSLIRENHDFKTISGSDIEELLSFLPRSSLCRHSPISRAYWRC